MDLVDITIWEKRISWEADQRMIYQPKLWIVQQAETALALKPLADIPQFMEDFVHGTSESNMYNIYDLG
jgi:hypothetical protein